MPTPIRVLAIASCLTFVACGAPPAAVNIQRDDGTNAAALEASYTITSVVTGMAVEVLGARTANGALVWQWEYLKQPNQRWYRRAVDGRSFALANENSGRVLEVENNSTANGARIQQWDWVSGVNQKWHTEDAGSGAVYLVNDASGKCLDAAGTANGARLQQWDCWKGANQRFLMQLATTAPQQRAGLYASGNRLLNSQGQRVRLHGVNIPSLEWNNGDPVRDSVPGPCWTGQSIMDSVKKAITDWRVNFIRLPISQDRWWNAVDGKGASYRATVDAIVDYAASKGVYVDVDLHWSDGGVWGKAPGQYDMPDDNTNTVLGDVAGHFANNPYVIIGIYNEPRDVTWSVWRNGGTVRESTGTYHTPGMEALVQTVRRNGFKNVVSVSGLDWAFDLRGLTQGHALSDNNVMYEAHVYPVKKDKSWWDANVTVVAGRYPILIGEFGASPNSEQGPYGTPDKFLQVVREWITANNYNFSAWSMHPGAGPSIIKDWCFNPTSYYGAHVIPWLGQ